MNICGANTSSRCKDKTKKLIICKEIIKNRGQKPTVNINYVSQTFDLARNCNQIAPYLATQIATRLSSGVS